MSWFGTNRDGVKGSEAAPKTSSSSGDRKGGDSKSRTEPDGQTSNYYGGKGKADGPNHSHTVVDDNGNVTYHREGGKR